MDELDPHSSIGGALVPSFRSRQRAGGCSWLSWMHERRNGEEIRHAYVMVLPVVEAMVSAFVELVQRLLRADGLAVAGVSGRAKDPESLVKKFVERPTYQDLRDVRDAVGIRVVCYYPSDVEAVVALLRREFDVIEVEQHGGASSPETFGYGSVHLILKLNPSRAGLTEYSTYRDRLAEVQVRTVLQDAWAVISHKLDYKTAAEVPQESRRTLYRVAALLETGDGLFDQFRREVEAARAEYATEVASSRLEDLALNLDSLMTAWPELETDGVVRRAVQFGFRDPAVDPQPDTTRNLLRRLVKVASITGLSRIADVQGLLARIEEDGDRLKAIADRAAGYGFRPWGNAPDVCSFFLAVEDQSVLKQLQTDRMQPAILRALKEVREEHR